MAEVAFSIEVDRLSFNLSPYTRLKGLGKIAIFANQNFNAMALEEILG